MRRPRLQTWMCCLLAVALLVATSQYLAHFHVPRAHAAMDHGHHEGNPGHGALEQCSLCLQFDRLPAPPVALASPDTLFFLIATLEAERLERLALDPLHLWPPSRGPPRLSC